MNPAGVRGRRLSSRSPPRRATCEGQRPLEAQFARPPGPSRRQPGRRPLRALEPFSSGSSGLRVPALLQCLPSAPLDLGFAPARPQSLATRLVDGDGTKTATSLAGARKPRATVCEGQEKSPGTRQILLRREIWCRCCCHKKSCGN